jgi:hypothetical protein
MAVPAKSTGILMEDDKWMAVSMPFLWRAWPPANPPLETRPLEKGLLLPKISYYPYAFRTGIMGLKPQGDGR